MLRWEEDEEGKNGGVIGVVIVMTMRIIMITMMMTMILMLMSMERKGGW